MSKLHTLKRLKTLTTTKAGVESWTEWYCINCERI